MAEVTQSPVSSVPTSPEPKSYEGKAKRVTERGNGLVEVYFKDDVTAFNAQKHALFAGKGAINSQISELLYNYLRTFGMAHHMVDRVDERTLLCHQAKMYALEVVVRFRTAGSLTKRTGLPAGTLCDPPVIEFYYKRDDLGDPMINFDHIHLLKLATAEEVASLSTAALKAATQLHKLCDRGGIDLVDIKFEYGRTATGVVLADEISPDTCRLHDKATGKMLDKDLFRQDAGDLLAGYREVFSRLQKAVEASTHV